MRNGRLSHPYNPDALIKLERQIVAVAERYRDTGTYSDFLQEQVELALATEQSVSRPQTIIAAVLDGIRELFGLRQADLPARDDEVDRVMATMTPFLRAQLVLSPLSATGQVASSFPVDRVPHVLATLYILGLCARQSGMAKVTFQTISRLYQQDAHLLKLCAHFDAFVSISKDRPVDFPVLTDANQRSSFLRIVKSLIHNRTASSPLSLGAVLGAEIRGEVQERMHFLRQVATTLPTSLIELSSDKSVSPGPLKSRVSAAFQRISISLPEELLLAAYNRKMDATITSQG